MAAPKRVPPKGTKMIRSPKVARATGFTTGTQKIKATKSKPVTTKAKPKATPPGKDPWSTGKIGEFVDSTIGQMTGKIPTPISGAMQNKTPVIPYTERNIKAIKKARP